MKRTISFSAPLLLVLAMLAAASANAQSWTFADPNVDYAFDLPDAAWKLTVHPNAASHRTELVYGDRREALLEVRRLDVAKSDTIADVIANDEQRHRQFMQGHVAGRIETFNGRLRGGVANFEYIAAARTMAGRYYFLRATDTTVYVLRFTGPADTLRALRVQTDQIARTFRVK
jgi:hypothetical protein